MKRKVKWAWLGVTQTGDKVGSHLGVILEVGTRVLSSLNSADTDWSAFNYYRSKTTRNRITSLLIGDKPGPLGNIRRLQCWFDDVRITPSRALYPPRTSMGFIVTRTLPATYVTGI